jgi:hypothetical protein
MITTQDSTPYDVNYNITYKTLATNLNKKTTYWKNIKEAVVS